MVIEYIFPSIRMVACQYVGWSGSRNRIKFMIAIVAVKTGLKNVIRPMSLKPDNEESLPVNVPVPMNKCVSF